MLDELSDSLGHIDYGYAGDLGEFTNSAGYLGVDCGDATIDGVYYEEASEEASRIFDGAIAPDATANDNLDSWCDSRTEFLDGFLATPGAPNDACGSSGSCNDNGEQIEVVSPQLGELVISEVFQNPGDPYADDDAEWFELYNASSETIHLNGVQFGKDPEDEADDIIASLDCIPVPAGEYALVARSDDPMLNGELPTPDWLTSMSLTNGESSLWVGVNDELLDLVTWSGSDESASYTLDPGSLDATANDDPLNWCEATELMFNEVAFGTPKAANESCPLPPPPEGQCYDNGELRDIVPIPPGDLEIVEVHPNPEAVADADGEWFELFVKSDGDLNGLNYGKEGAWDSDSPIEPLSFEVGECYSVSAGDRFIVAREADQAVNGGLPPVDFLFDMALTNSNTDLIIGYGDDPSMPDEAASWTSVTAGAALSKDSNGVWCDAVDPYGDGDLGTPVDPNPMCGGGGGGEGMCIDPDNDMERQIAFPQMGELTLSEVMPNPSTAEPGGEWFELYTLEAIDLNGLQLGKNGAFAHTVNSEFCIEVPADSYVVLARSDVEAENCSLPVVDYVYAGLSLSNGGGNNVEIGYDDVIWDSHTWAGATSNGVAESYDPTGMSWCEAVDAFGCGDLATPGAANPACGIGGGGGEGMCLDGNAMRAVVTPQPGDLVISEFMANPAAVGDTAGEWFEIHALGSFDLNELDIGRAFADGSIHTIDAAECLAMSPGDEALLARNGDAMANGGMDNVTYVYSSLGLNNSNSALHVAAGGVLLDEVTWTSTSTGASTSLDPGALDPDTNDLANNAEPSWCYEATPYGAGDEGTPGLANNACN